MTEYTAALPFWLSPEAIEELRGLGAVELTYRIEAPSREDAIRLLGDEYEWRGLGREWWRDALSGGRKCSDARDE